MEERYVFLGDFKGMFYTFQIIPLENSGPFPEGQEHDINIYRGALQNAEYHDEFKPEEFKNLNSFLLSNVPKIQIAPIPPSPFIDKRTYNFSKLLLLKPTVEKSYDLNGRTYGIITSKAYGITEKFPLTRFDGDEVSQGYYKHRKNTVLVDEEYEQNPSEKQDDSQNESGLSENWDSFKERASKLFSGCLANFWTILISILVLYFIFSMLKGCSTEEDQCEMKGITKRNLYKEKIAFWKTKKAYEANLVSVLNAYSRIYFYKNETTFHLNSIGKNGPITKLFKLMSAYEEKNFIIEGYVNGISNEVEGLDLRRAKRLRDKFISMGIKPERLKVIGKKNEPQLEPTWKMNTFYVNKGMKKEYNRNMRVEIKLNKTIP
jgi:outer membrane protein OmpA-like peptidoglycan-associated protein